MGNPAKMGKVGHYKNCSYEHMIERTIAMIYDSPEHKEWILRKRRFEDWKYDRQAHKMQRRWEKKIEVLIREGTTIDERLSERRRREYALRKKKEV